MASHLAESKRREETGEVSPVLSAVTGWLDCIRRNPRANFSGLKRHRLSSPDILGFDSWIDGNELQKRQNETKPVPSLQAYRGVSGRSEVASGAAVGGPWSASGRAQQSA